MVVRVCNHKAVQGGEILMMLRIFQGEKW